MIDTPYRVRTGIYEQHDSHQGQAEDDEGHDQDLGAAADDRREQVGVRREAEDVGVDKLPARLLRLVDCKQAPDFSLEVRRDARECTIGQNSTQAGCECRQQRMAAIACATATERGHGPASSSRENLMKSFFRTRMRMVARKPVSSSTVTQLLMMLNQWICGM